MSSPSSELSPKPNKVQRLEEERRILPVSLWKSTMVGTNLKAETISLMDKRTVVEADMNSIIERLRQPGGPGLSGNLLDSEGFPRADIDIPAVRADRNWLAVLKNDHKDLTEKINQNIQLLHAARPSFGYPSLANSEHTQSRNIPVPMDADVEFNIPFVMVDEITDGCPAAEDGLELGDQIVRFGNVVAGVDSLTRLAIEMQSNLGCAIPMVVLRRGEQMSLSVTPRTWGGRGSLGCHFRAI